MILRILTTLGWSLLWLLALVATAWSLGALHYDFPLLPGIAPWLFLALLAGALTRARGCCRKPLVLLAGFFLVLGWWLTLRPSNQEPWQADVAQTAWAEINGDQVTFHNVRNCEYRTELDYTPRWESRTVRLSSITGVDIAINYWGSPWIAHPIASFQFSDAPPLCFSIETRKKVGQSYSAIGGLYRQFALTYVVADERDVLRVRTNYRVGEDIYLYRTAASAGKARERFLEYVHSLNQIRDHPRWYNAITTNCTTSIRDQHPSAKRAPWDWRILVNGKGDELMFERNSILTDGLPFPELKARSLIDEAAKAANDSPNFSQLIRSNRPGFH